MNSLPRWADGVLRCIVPREWADDVADDLAERYAEIAATRGGVPARAWMVRQLAAWVVRGLPHKLAAFLRTGVTDALRGDARLAGRRLAAEPTLSAAVVATLALGIGGTTAAFAVVDGVLLRPLPFPDASELYAVRGDRNGRSWWAVSMAESRAWAEHARGLEGIAWSQGGGATLALEGQPVFVRTARVSPGFFDVLGVPPALGRGFVDGDDLAGAEAKAVLTHRLWKERFEADPGVLGRAVVLDEVPHTIVGVAGPTPVVHLADHDLFVPHPRGGADVPEQARVLRAVVRLPRDTDEGEVAAELHRVMAEQQVPGADAGWIPRLVPLRAELVGDVRAPLLAILGAVVGVMLVACLNVLGLLLARSEARRVEAAVRRALGAGRVRLFRQTLVESLLLAALAGVAGLILAAWGTSALTGTYPHLLPRTPGTVLNPRVLAFVGLLVLASGLLFGLAAGWAFSSGGDAVRSGRGRLPGRREGRVGAALLAAEMAFAMVLLVGAGLMLRSLDALRAVDPGFDASGTLVVDILLPSARHAAVDDQVRAMESVRDALAALPGVVAVGSVTNLPLRGPGYTGWHVVESLPEPAPGAEATGGVEMASPDYFTAHGVPVISGRIFDSLEAANGRALAVVNETMARTFWPKSSPVGDRVRFGPAGSTWFDVVGVVGDVRYDLTAPARPRLYVPERRGFGPVALRTTVLRSSLPPEVLAPSVREVVGLLLPGAPVVRVESMEEVAAGALTLARLQAILMTLFGVVGVALGAVGTFGLVSYRVERRRREVGLRMALGATPGNVVAGLLVRILRPVGVGLLVGVAASLLLGGVFDRIVYGVDPRSAGVMASLAATLLAVAVAAALGPALGATRLDPGRALARE